jgi:hypothetical protein
MLPTQAEEGGVTIPWLRVWGLVGGLIMAATAFASTALADPNLVSRPTPGMHVADGNGGCTAAFAAQDNDGSYYLLTSGHCDPHDGSVWTYGEDRPLGMITESEKVGHTKDAAIIRLDASVGPPTGDVGDRYPVRDVLSLSQIQIGMPFCKLGDKPRRHRERGRDLDVFARRRRLHDVFHARVSIARQVGLAHPSLTLVTRQRGTRSGRDVHRKECCEGSAREFSPDIG